MNKLVKISTEKLIVFFTCTLNRLYFGSRTLLSLQNLRPLTHQGYKRPALYLASLLFHYFLRNLKSLPEKYTNCTHSNVRHVPLMYLFKLGTLPQKYKACDKTLPKYFDLKQLSERDKLTASSFSWKFTQFTNSLLIPNRTHSLQTWTQLKPENFLSQNT